MGNQNDISRFTVHTKQSFLKTIFSAATTMIKLVAFILVLLSIIEFNLAQDSISSESDNLMKSQLSEKLLTRNERAALFFGRPPSRRRTSWRQKSKRRYQKGSSKSTVRGSSKGATLSEDERRQRREQKMEKKRKDRGHKD